MSHKRNEALRHVQHSMHHVIAAGEGSDRAPDSCKLCPYYRPDFKFRTCLYAHCPYKKQVNVFRSTPEKWDILYTHREEITLHKAAKAAFDETGLKKLPKVKALNAEYSDLLTQKKAAYPDYRKAREEMQEFVKAQKNIELFFAEEKDAQEKQKTR